MRPVPPGANAGTAVKFSTWSEIVEMMAPELGAAAILGVGVIFAKPVVIDGQQQTQLSCVVSGISEPLRSSLMQALAAIIGAEASTAVRKETHPPGAN